MGEAVKGKEKIRMPHGFNRSAYLNWNYLRDSAANLLPF